MKYISFNLRNTHIGNHIRPIVVQSMCNCDTNDIDSAVAQCREISAAGGTLVRLTTQGLKEVESLVNDAISRKLPVVCEEMSVEAAREAGAMGLFGDKYGEVVKVYTMGDVSKEICGGPHAENTGDLEAFKILKEESSSRGVRRIKAVIGKAALK